MRELLFRLRDQGKTILISSHLLAEIEKICDYICIIDSGKIVFYEKIESLQNILANEIQYRIKSNTFDKVEDILNKSDVEINKEDDSISFYLPNDTIVSKYIKTMIEQGG